MKKTKQILTALFLAALLIPVLCVPAFALTESEVEAQVAASGKEAVTGNVLIWFLCAVAFLKVSQKIDSFMATLGVNVGHTGGSMLAEAMIAMRAITMVVGGGHGGGAGHAGSAAGSSAAGKSGSSGMSGFFKGGLVGMAGRHITNSAVRTATTQTTAVHTTQNQVQQAAASSASAARTAADTHVNSEIRTGGSSVYTKSAAPAGAVPQEGVIATGRSPVPQTVSEKNVQQTASHTKDAVPAGAPPQEGVIVTNSSLSPRPDSVENTPPASPVPTGMPPQEGVILNGSEPPPSGPPTGPMPNTVGEPPEGTPPDVPAPEVPGGENTVHAPQTENIFGGGAEGTVHVENTAVTGGGQHTQDRTERVQASHTSASSERVQTNRFLAGAGARPTLGGMVFSRSLAAGGSFANDVIGTVARGEVAGSITGDLAAQSLQSYMGHTAIGSGDTEKVSYSQVEIGGGRITGREVTPEHPQGIEFAMYHVDQYAKPEGNYQKVFSADGAAWYKQHAVDTVVKTPFKAPDGEIDYQKEIVKRLPTPPKRKDRM